jgi:hypothetical protein
MKEVYRLTRAAMLQAAHILQKLYPEEFTRASLEDHVDDLLNRFQNSSLKDTVFREGNRNPEDVVVLDLFQKNPDSALSEICGLEKEIYPAVYQQASTLDADSLKSFTDRRPI